MVWRLLCCWFCYVAYDSFPCRPVLCYFHPSSHIHLSIPQGEFRPLAVGEFLVASRSSLVAPCSQESPRQPVLFHPSHMTRPLQLPPHHISFYAAQLAELETLCRCDPAVLHMPHVDAAHGPNTTMMKTPQLVPQLLRQAPTFTAIQQYR